MLHRISHALKKSSKVLKSHQLLSTYKYPGHVYVINLGHQKLDVFFVSFMTFFD